MEYVNRAKPGGENRIGEGDLRSARDRAETPSFTVKLATRCPGVVDRAHF